MIPGIETLACGNLAVPVEVMEHVVEVESSRNPFAIGVVGARLQRQPRHLAEAVATVRMLEDSGYNYSVGLAQINRINFSRFGIDVPEQAFDTCINVRTGAQILAECLQRHEGQWGRAFSCYYSGNGETGYRDGYVQKVFASMASSRGLRGEAVTQEVGAIPLARPGDPADAPRASVIASAARANSLIAARVTATNADRRLPLVQSSPAYPTDAEIGQVDLHEDVRNLPAEEAFMRIARARMSGAAHMAQRATDHVEGEPTDASHQESSMRVASATEQHSPDTQQQSKPAVDPARVF